MADPTVEHHFAPDQEDEDSLDEDQDEDSKFSSEYSMYVVNIILELCM